MSAEQRIKEYENVPEKVGEKVELRGNCKEILYSSMRKFGISEYASINVL